MTRPTLVLALLAAVPCVALLPRTRAPTIQHRAPLTRCHMATPQMALSLRALNPFDLSGIDRPNRSRRVEGAEYYRLIGVHPDAPHAEIREKTDMLINTRYAGDVKKKIKLEIAYDKIMEMRFQAAASGDLVKEAAAQMVSDIERADEEALEEASKRGGFFDMSGAEEDNQGVFVKPIDKKRIYTTAPVFFGMAMFGLLWTGVLPPMVLLIKGLMHIIALNMIYMRDRPVANDGMGENIFTTSQGSFDTGDLTKAMSILVVFNLAVMLVGWMLRVAHIIPQGIGVGLIVQAVANSAAVALTKVHGVSK